MKIVSLAGQDKSYGHKKATLHYCKAALNVFTTE